MQYRCDRIYHDRITIPSSVNPRERNQRLKLETYITRLRDAEIRYFRKRAKQMRWRRQHRIEWLAR